MNGLEDRLEGIRDQLELDSRLTELSRVQPWIDAIANRFGVGEETRFALHLCLEEALANVVLHGYKNEPGHPIRVAFSVVGSSLLLSIEDCAPPFAPTESVPRLDASPRDTLESLQPGGNGIRLMRRFAGSLEYQPTSGGNRLIIGFPITPK